MLKRLILPAALLLAITPAAFAQQPAQGTPATSTAKPAQQKLTPEQQQAIMKFRQQMAGNAQAIAQLIDQGKAGDVWDQSSEVMKKSSSRNDFVSGVTRQRDNAGKLVSRKLLAMYRNASKGDNKQLPAGQYFNVVFLSQFSSQKQPMHELVSYHYDSDKVLRVSGYTLQQPKPAANAARH